MIFDVIYDFYSTLFYSNDDLSSFWASWECQFWDGEDYLLFYGSDVISAIATVITIICGIFALFRILGGVLRLFKV